MSGKPFPQVVTKLNFGERYLATRSRISDVLEGIATLARDTHADIGDIFSLSSIEQELRKPFLFVFCGETNSGKSSLVNALIGHELCPVNILPETDRVILYRYGNSALDTAISPTLQESLRPIGFLRDFNILDTPGTNSGVEGHWENTEKFLPDADLIVFVFPSANPWGAATWNRISALPADCQDRIVFVIQQADRRDPADIRIIIEHVGDLSSKRIGFIPPIFAVSARDSGRGGNTDGEGYGRSGFAALVEFITRQICGSSHRQEVLHTWRIHAADALRKIEDHIENQTRTVGIRHTFLNSLEEEIDTMRENLVARLPDHLTGVADVFETEAIWVTQNLRSALGILHSFLRIFVGDRTGSRTESLFIERLRKAVEAVAESDALDIVSSCRNHWDELGERVKESIGVEIQGSEAVNEKLEQARCRFVSRIGRAAHQAIGNLHVRRELEFEIRRRNLALKSFTATALLALIFGATLGILEVPLLPLVFCGLGLTFFLGGAVIALTTRRRITRDFQHSLLNTCGSFADTLRVDYEAALRIFFQDYTSCLSYIRKHLAEDKLAIEPKLKRWHDLFLTLKSIEQDI